MRDNKLHTPDGVKDFLPGEAARKQSVERKIEYVFTGYGYERIVSPMFEYLEVFEGKGGVSRSEMYSFLDRDGSVLALRTEMTPVAARIAATSYSKDDIPLRFCYIENAFRYNEKYQGKLKEFTQAGIELIGADGSDADAEAVAVAVNSLVAAGLADFRINVGQAGFINGILAETGLDADLRERLRGFIIQREFTAADELVRNSSVPDGVRAVIGELPLMIGGTEILDFAGGFVTNGASLAALDELRRINEILGCYGVGGYVSFDLSMIGFLDYYNGIIFEGYARGSGETLISGGRYDGLSGMFGADYPAVGFAIKINEIVSALGRQRKDETDNLIVRTLAAFSGNGKKNALLASDGLRMQGLCVENSLCGDDLETNIGYARKRGIGGVLFFTDSGDVIAADVLTGNRRTVKIEEILGKGGVTE